MRDLPGSPLEDPYDVLPANLGDTAEQLERQRVAEELLPKWQQTLEVLLRVDALHIESISSEVQTAIRIADGMINGLESIIGNPLNDTPANQISNNRDELKKLATLTTDECDIPDQEAWGADSIE